VNHSKIELVLYLDLGSRPEREWNRAIHLGNRQTDWKQTKDTTSAADDEAFYSSSVCCSFVRFLN
jgi:hypothetical protein